jgi:hypothetical protein
VTPAHAAPPAHADHKVSRVTQDRPVRAGLEDGVALKGRVVQWGSRANLDRPEQPDRLARLVQQDLKDPKALLVHVGLKARKDTAVQPARVVQLELRATRGRVAQWASAPALWFT